MNYLERFERGTKGMEALSVGVYPHDTCTNCKGAGTLNDDNDQCEPCDGRGTICECRECAYLDPENNEGGFSWSSCDTCGSGLGGDRHPAHFLLRDAGAPSLVGAEVTHVEVCGDCLFFIANGDLPDESEGEDE